MEEWKGIEKKKGHKNNTRKNCALTVPWLGKSAGKRASRNIVLRKRQGPNKHFKLSRKSQSKYVHTQLHTQLHTHLLTYIHTQEVDTERATTCLIDTHSIVNQRLRKHCTSLSSHTGFAHSTSYQVIKGVVPNRKEERLSRSYLHQMHAYCQSWLQFYLRGYFIQIPYIQRSRWASHRGPCRARPSM